MSGYGNDASLINPKLKHISAKPWEAGEEMGYWPRYETIPARCRGAYLQWLASGRSEPSAHIGYVFLFFYGLERRIFIDGQQGKVAGHERLQIVEEVKRLLEIYGSNRSFRGYANNFLAMEWVLFQRDDTLPDYINFDDRYCAEPFQFLLGQKVLKGEPIPAKMALQWLILSPEYGLRTPARRCAKEFQSLFFHRYEERLKDGLIVKPNKTHLKLEYHAASPSIGGRLSLNIPDTPNSFLLKGPINKLSALAEECTNELESYSRYIRRKENDPASLTALALLPKELMTMSTIVSKAKSELEHLCLNGPKEVSFEELYNYLGEEPPSQFRKKDFENLAILLEGLGLGIAPDVRYHGVKPSENDNVVLFSRGHGINFKPSRDYFTTGAILRLCAMVSQIDVDLSPAEEILLQNLVRDNRELNNIEKESLLAFLHWCLRTPQGTTGLKQCLAHVSDMEKTAISHILISVAYADGHIDPREIKQLEKLYTTLGLDKTQVTSDLHNIVANEPVTVDRRDPDISYAIPQPKSYASSKEIQLNEALIRIREEETRRVKGVLEGIFSESPKDDSDLKQEIIPSSATVNPLTSLDKNHRELFDHIRTREVWDRDVIRNMCQKLGLMMDGAMEVLNEWAFDNSNAPLIEDGETIYVDINLAKEIIND